jgi:radical SAM superfamily enzyme YgiQ (UPF0313 family)
MKILFIGKYYYCENLPLMYLSRYLKFEKNIINEVKKIALDIIAYNIVLGMSDLFLQVNIKLKKHILFLSIFGGLHCTIYPEMIYEDGVDGICRGEGEFLY